LALGLKPIMKPSWRFKSFIETCSHKNDFATKSSLFLPSQSLPDAIKVVSYGHLNTMQNYPFIYKRNGLTLLSSDVSVSKSPATEPIYLIGYGDNKVTTYKYDNVNNENPDIEKIKELDEIKEYTEENILDDKASKSNIEWEVHNDYFKSVDTNAEAIDELRKSAENLESAANEAIKVAKSMKKSGGRKNSTRKKRKRKTIKKNKKKRKTIKKNRKTIKKKRKARKN